MGNALHLPAKNGNMDAFRKVLTDNPKIDISNKNKNGNTPLHKACQYGNISIVTELVGLGADINAKNRDGYTPLHLAAMKGKTDACEELLTLGAEKDIEGGVWASTPLHWACINNHVETAKLLILKGASTTIKDGVEKTPLCFIKDVDLRAELMGAPIVVRDIDEDENLAKLERQRLREAAKERRRLQEEAEKEQKEKDDEEAAEEKEKMIDAAKEKKKILDVAQKRKEEGLSEVEAESSDFQEIDDPDPSLGGTVKSAPSSAKKLPLGSPLKFKAPETENYLTSPTKRDQVNEAEDIEEDDDVQDFNEIIASRKSAPIEHDNNESDDDDEDHYNSPIRDPRKSAV